MKNVVRFTNIILAALLAGVSFGIWIGFSPLHLSQLTYLEQQQNMLGSLRILMILLVIGATIVTVVSAFLQRKNKAIFVALILAAICFLACILITKFGNVPIDNVVMTWNADLMPANWMELRNRWWSFHITRTIAELAALALITWATIHNTPRHEEEQKS